MQEDAMQVISDVGLEDLKAEIARLRAELAQAREEREALRQLREAAELVVETLPAGGVRATTLRKLEEVVLDTRARRLAA